MANVGQIGWFGFADGQGVRARRAIVAGVEVIGGGVPDDIHLHVEVSRLDNDVVEESERLENQPDGRPRLILERICKQEIVATAGAFWLGV